MPLAPGARAEQVRLRTADEERIRSTVGGDGIDPFAGQAHWAAPGFPMPIFHVVFSYFLAGAFAAKADAATRSWTRIMIRLPELIVPAAVCQRCWT